MTSEQLIEKLSAELWDKTSFQPNSKNIQLFWERLKGVEIDDFIVYNFLNYQGTYLENLILSTFTLWRNFDIEKWREIFVRLEGNGLAEYYMKVIADRFLGIDPEFKSTKELLISAIIPPDNHIEIDSHFVPTMTGKLKDIYEKSLRDNFELTLNDLIEVNNRLTGYHGLYKLRD